jgi:hypothetical protein
MPDLRVNINGIEYMPKTHGFRLTDDHFELAKRYSNAFDVIHWAHENQADLATMRAWANENAKQVEQEQVSAKKPKTRGLFDS